MDIINLFWLRLRILKGLNIHKIKGFSCAKLSQTLSSLDHVSLSLAAARLDIFLI